MTNVELTLPAWNLQESAGAKPMHIAGWKIAAHYGDPEAEYRAATAGVGLMDVSFLTKVTAAGKDHVEYLNRRLSQRVIDQVPGQGQRANQLSGEGRLEADFVFYRATDELSFLIAPPAVSGPYLQQLCDKYVFSEDARFEDHTAEWAAFALLGPETPKVLAALDLTRPEGLGIRAACVAQQKGYLMNVDFLAGAAVVLVPAADAPSVWAAMQREVVAAGGRAVGFLPFDSIRVEHGLAWWGIDLNDRAIPLEADLMAAIHTNKGCYPGQETIAKILNLGHPARKLVGVVVESDDPPVAGVTLQVDGKEAGTLTSSTWSPSLGRSIGLAMVRWAHRNAGTTLLLPGDIRATVVALPFAPVDQSV